MKLLQFGVHQFFLLHQIPPELIPVLSFPELKTHLNEITIQLKNSSIATVERVYENKKISPNKAHIIFKPDIQYQMQVARNSVSFR